jgi:hypothetical protein
MSFPFYDDPTDNWGHYPRDSYTGDTVEEH